MASCINTGSNWTREQLSRITLEINGSDWDREVADVVVVNPCRVCALCLLSARRQRLAWLDGRAFILSVLACFQTPAASNCRQFCMSSNALQPVLAVVTSLKTGLLVGFYSKNNNGHRILITSL